MLAKEEEIQQRLRFAQRRITELLALNRGNLGAAEVDDKHQLIQEVFFHLGGATEVLARIVNDVRKLGLVIDVVTKSKVLQRLSKTDPAYTPLSDLNPNTRKDPMPADPYSEEGLLYRIFNYRHQVTHRGRNPFLYRVGDIPEVSLILDPRLDPKDRTPSTKSLADELQEMAAIVDLKCTKVIQAL